MRKISRRQFFKRGTAAVATALAAPYIIPSSVLGKNGSVPPSERIGFGAVGIGPRGTQVLRHFLTFNDLQCLAVCDVQIKRRAEAKAVVDDNYKNKDCASYIDFRELLARDDIDAVLIATGDRWHAIASILSAKAGKDVYCEKPMTLTVAEGRALADTMNRYGTVYQCGHQRRSVDAYQFMVEAVRRGMIGKLHTITASLYRTWPCIAGPTQPVPEGFDYDMWLGPAPYAPYTPELIGFKSLVWDYGGGAVTDMGTHLVDIAQWAHDSEMSAPIEYEGKAEFPKYGLVNTPLIYDLWCTYADGVRLNIISGATGDFTADRWIKFEGTEGWIRLHDETSTITAEPKSILKARGRAFHTWIHAGGHVRNFLDCIKTRALTTCPAEISHRSTTICHVGNICLRLGRKVRWNSQTEQFVSDPEADRMLSRTMRAPWHL